MAWLRPLSTTLLPSTTPISDSHQFHHDQAGPFYMNEHLQQGHSR